MAIDVEIEAMSAVAAALAELDEVQQRRVLRWAAERFNVVLGKGRVTTGMGGADDPDDGDNQTDEEISGEVSVFEHFAELFAAAQPKSNEDKALVAAYWVQAIQGTDQWASRLLNVELKNLGHSIPNITHALTSNMGKKPQRIVQLRKSGSSRQATKTYKVTHEGLTHVRGMLSGGGA